MTNLNPTSEPERLHAPNISDSKGDKEISDTGGCYGNGRYVLSSGFPLMNLSTEGMLEGVEYFITLVVTKGRRRSIATQTLQLVPGDPPALTIRYRATLTYIYIHHLFIHVTPRSTKDSLKRARAACC